MTLLRSSHGQFSSSSCVLKHVTGSLQMPLGFYIISRRIFSFNLKTLDLLRYCIALTRPHTLPCHTYLEFYRFVVFDDDVSRWIKWKNPSGSNVTLLGRQHRECAAHHGQNQPVPEVPLRLRKPENRGLLLLFHRNWCFFQAFVCWCGTLLSIYLIINSFPDQKRAA